VPWITVRIRRPKADISGGSQGSWVTEGLAKVASNSVLG
jgi:hypothetical protein